MPLIKTREATFCGQIGLVIRSVVAVEIGRRVDGSAESVISHESEVMAEAFFDLQDTPLVNTGPLGRILVGLENCRIYKAIDDLWPLTVWFVGPPLPHRDSLRQPS